MKNKYSLADAFVKQYTASDATKEKEAPKENKEAPKEKEQKKEKKHHHHHKHHKKHHHHKDEDDKKDEKDKKPEENDQKPDDKKSFLQLKDDWDQDEDKEILESLKYAENKLGKKMATPHALPKEHAFAPVKYDVEEMQTG